LGFWRVGSVRQRWGRRTLSEQKRLISALVGGVRVLEPLRSRMDRLWASENDAYKLIAGRAIFEARGEQAEALCRWWEISTSP